MNSISDDGYDDVQPPSQLYKYLSAERVSNVLEQGTVRFTPLLSTNDSFEVRMTFESLVGPRFLEMIGEVKRTTMSDDSLDAMLLKQLQEFGLHDLQAIPKPIREGLKRDIRKQVSAQLDGAIMPLLSNPAAAEVMLEKLGRDLLCFSLSERSDIATMWAHYAGNHQGFVVAFDTSSEWFAKRKDGQPTRIRKVAYFDGTLEEPLQAPELALCSKTTDWAYEREWRLYARAPQIDATFGNANDPVHVINFPVDAVSRVIVGAKASLETTERIRSILKEKYPHARLTRAEPNRRTLSYDEVDL